MRRPSLASLRSPRGLLEAAGLVVFLVIVFLFVATAVPQLVGADQAYVVQTDSMSPAIGAGSVVFVSDVAPSQIEVGDVITFERSGDESNRVTHRVVEVQATDSQPQFRTKGDANEEPDPEPVPASAVVGAVSFHVPFLGYAIAFGGSGTGLLVLVVIPAVLLLVLEARDLLTSTGEEASAADARESTPTRGDAAGSTAGSASSTERSQTPDDASPDREVTDGGE